MLTLLLRIQWWNRVWFRAPSATIVPNVNTSVCALRAMISRSLRRKTLHSLSVARYRRTLHLNKNTEYYSSLFSCPYVRSGSSAQPPVATAGISCMADPRFSVWSKSYGAGCLMCNDKPILTLGKLKLTTFLRGKIRCVRKGMAGRQRNKKAFQSCVRNFFDKLLSGSRSYAVNRWVRSMFCLKCVQSLQKSLSRTSPRLSLLF